MVNAIGKVYLGGLIDEDAQYTFNVAAGITAADVGKAVTIDSTAANTVKLASDGDQILGRLEVVEVRSLEGVNVATVSLKGGMVFTVTPDALAIGPDEIPAVGDYLLGGNTAGAAKGYVQKASTGNTVVTRWLVTEVLNSGAQVVAISL